MSTIRSRSKNSVALCTPHSGWAASPPRSPCRQESEIRWMRESCSNRYTVRAYADDKLLYLLHKRLKDRELSSGTVPTHGYAWYGKDRAVVTTHGVKNLEEGLKRVTRSSMHQLGHLWDLHHCLDPRCSMYPPWTPSFANGEPIFCTFDREKSEQKIRLA